VPSNWRAGCAPDQGGANLPHDDARAGSVTGLVEGGGVTHVGMESTGVYWRPVYTVLEGHFELIVGNARHIRKCRGARLT
jgi:transposase